MASSVPKPKHNHSTLEFPKGFLWGAATSAHQVEGENINSDWWEWEIKNQPESKRSGKADDQYHLYRQDFELAKKLGHNSHRLSIEWARIEKCPNQFDQAEIDHYKEELKTLKEMGFTVMLTIQHFTLPLWLSKKGGWENLKTPYYFNRFVKKVVPELKDYVDLWITINEPNTYVFMSYQGGDKSGNWPPQKKNNLLAILVMWNMARAHKMAYQSIHSILPNAKVGVTNSINSFESFHKHSVLEQAFVVIDDFFANHSFYCLSGSSHDFLGVNYYFNWRINQAKDDFWPRIVDTQPQGREASDLGWEIYPEGIFEVLTDLSDDIPIYITECGIASTNDDRRNRFLIHYLSEVYRAIKSGVNVRGFFYWSLIDNFEWHLGFDPRFGIVEVDYKTMERTPRPSALVYKDVILHNGIPHKLLKFMGHSVQAMEVLEDEVIDLELTKSDMEILEKAQEEEKRVDGS